uniref:HAUS augmin-like complex subunit 6 N-terminal domain-containing protein n=1 Tax=Strongyloides stercoralis TaxID=6248 RepID=A0A0K0E6H5_STRER
MQTSQYIIKQNITFLNDNIPNLNIKYEDLFNKNGKCNFSRIVLYIYETITSDKTGDIYGGNFYKIPYHVLMGSQKLYSIKKVQKILETFLNKDSISIKKINRPDNILICETLNFLKKLFSAGVALRMEMAKIDDEIERKKNLTTSLEGEKNFLENMVSSYDGTGKMEEIDRQLFQVHEEYSKQEEVKEKLLLDIKRFDEEREYLKCQMDVAKKREIDLEKEYEQTLSLLTNTKSEMIFNDTFVEEENKRSQVTLLVLEEEKNMLENKIENLHERLSLLHQLNEIIDTKNLKLDDLKNLSDSIKIVNEKIDEECKDIEENYKTFFTFSSDSSDLLRKNKFETKNLIDIVKNVYLFKVNEFIEKTKKDVESLETIDKNELFKNKYINEINELFK